MQHVHDEGFQAEHYFINHPEQALSSLAFDLSIDKEQLSRYHGDTDAECLADVVPSLIASMKLHLARTRMNQLIEQTKKPEVMKDRQALHQLMQQYFEVKKKAEELARQASDRVVIR